MKFGIAAKLGVVLAVVGMLAAGITGLYAYNASKGLLVQSAKEELLTSTRVLARRITLVREEWRVPDRLRFGDDELVPQQNWSEMVNLAMGTTTSHNPSSRASEIFVSSEMQRAGLIDDLVETDRREIRKLHLDDRPHALDGRTHGVDAGLVVAAAVDVHHFLQQVLHGLLLAGQPVQHLGAHGGVHGRSGVLHGFLASMGGRPASGVKICG